MMTVEDIVAAINEYHSNSDEADSIIIFRNPDFADAFIGLTYDGMNAVYDYDKMVESLVKNDGMDEVDAIEFIEYNTIRALPYMNSEGRAPVVVRGLSV